MHGGECNGIETNYHGAYGFDFHTSQRKCRKYRRLFIHIGNKYGREYFFLADHPHIKRDLLSKKVSDTVLGEIAEIARTAGDLGPPEEYDFTEESTSHSFACVYSLRWTDETETGTAKEQIFRRSPWYRLSNLDIAFTVIRACSSLYL